MLSFYLKASQQQLHAWRVDLKMLPEPGSIFPLAYCSEATPTQLRLDRHQLTLKPEALRDVLGLSGLRSVASWQIYSCTKLSPFSQHDVP